MVTCPRCGASVEPSALVCPYCQLETRRGMEHAERQQAYAHQAAQADQARYAAERHARQQALDKKALHAMGWSLGGSALCCVPVAIVGLVMGLGVRSTAKKEGLVAPLTSTVAVVSAVVGMLVFGLALALGIQQQREADARIAVLKAASEGVRDRETIDQRLGCALAELALLQDGFDGKTRIEAFECNGKLTQNGETAELLDVRFRTSSSVSDRHAVTACLVRGSRWSVKELREDGSCAPRPASAPAAAPRASAR